MYWYQMPIAKSRYVNCELNSKEAIKEASKVDIERLRKEIKEWHKMD